MEQLEDIAAVFARLKPWRTDMESFNSLVDLAAQYLQGHRELADVQQQLERVDQELGQLRLQYQDGIRFQEPSEELDNQSLAAWWMFHHLQRQFQRLSHALQENLADEAAAAVQECNAAVNQLFRSFATLRQSLQRTEKYSQSPYVHELIRVGKACLNGTLSVELFHERFEAFCLFHDQFIESLQEFLPRMQESGAHQPLVPAMEEQNASLDEIANYFLDGDEVQLGAALERLQSSTTALLAIQESLLVVEAPPVTQVCLRCGTENGKGDRFCSSCQGRLIDSQEPLQSRALDEQILPPNLHKVMTAAESFRARDIDRADFLEVIQWYDGLASKAHQQMRDLTPPPAEGLPAEQLALYNEALGAVDLALSDLKTGLVRLRKYADHRDPLELEFGMASCLAGHQHMQRFVALHQSVGR